MHESPTNLDGLKKATGQGFRKHISEYDSKIIPIPVAHPATDRWVTYNTKELTSVCPLSGLPDFYDCTIEILPDEHVPELKTLKFYLMAWRDVGVLHEDLAQQIVYDINAAVSPLKVTVVLIANVRGGIATSVTAMYPPDDESLN